MSESPWNFDGVLAFAFVVSQVDAQLDGEQITCQDRIGARVDKAGQLRRAPVTICQGNLHEGAEDPLAKPSRLGVLPIPDRATAAAAVAQPIPT